jgi:uncharacterized membrane protein (DUF4010 family)
LLSCEKIDQSETLGRRERVSTLAFEEVFLGFLVAVAAGALIGIEREQSQALQNRPHLGGVRTFPLIALTGALVGLSAYALGIWPVLIAMGILGVFLGVGYYQEWRVGVSPGITTEIAALITFLLGTLTVLPGLPLATGQRYLVIIASAAVVMALLSFKEPLHQAVVRFSVDDMYATAKFVILALVVLPLLPDQTYGPFDVLNPFNIGLMVVLIAGLSFIGYVAVRMVGAKRGLAFTGLLGGLVSSTAVTVSLASKARQDRRLLVPATMAMLTAWSTMFVRMLVIVGILDPTLLLKLWPLAVMAVAGYVSALVFYLQLRGEVVPGSELSFRNPFELAPAFRFGLFYAVVMFVSKAAQVLLGDRGLYASSIFSGLADVDAITLSVLRFHQEGMAARTAVIAITLAGLTNTIVKVAIATWLGGARMGRYVLTAGLIILLAGGVALLLS